MGEIVFLQRLFSTEDRGAYLVCSLLGYVLFLALRPALWAPYVALLVTYHCFLGFKLYHSNKDTSRTYNFAVTAAAHLGFVVVLMLARFLLVGSLLVFMHPEPRSSFVLAALIASKVLKLAIILSIYGLVTLERSLFFSGPHQEAAVDPTEIESLVVELASRNKPSGQLTKATDHDHELWVQYCARRKATFYDPRKSPREDFEQWLRAHGKTQYPTA